MKKSGLLILFATLILSGLFAQLDPFMPQNPITMGQGGSYTANAEGYNAFFYNPAGFSRMSELTLASVNVYGLMDRAILDLALQAINGQGIGSATTPSISSRELTLNGIDVSQLEGMVTNLTNYITDVGNYDPGILETAITTVMNENSALSDLVTQYDTDPSTPGIQLDTTVTPEQLLADVLASDVDIAAVLDSFVEEVDTAATAAGYTGADAAAYGVDNIGTQLEQTLTDALPAGDFMAGVNVGVGYVGNGLGIGLFANAQATVTTPEGESILNAAGTAIASVTVEGGFSFPLFDGFYLGFAVRPTILGYTTIDAGYIISQLVSASGGNSDFVSALFSNSIYKGFYLGIDAGMLWDIGPFTLGAVLKDINPFQTQYSVINPSDYASLEEALAAVFRLDEGTLVPDSSALYNVPPFKLNLGAQFHPDLGGLSAVFDPRVGLDFMDVFGFLRNYETDVALQNQKYVFLDHVNIGAEVELLGFLDVRAGFYQRNLTAGLGVELPIVHVNAAFAFGNLNVDTYEFDSIGFSLELALRFPEAKTYGDKADK